MDTKILDNKLKQSEGPKQKRKGFKNNLFPINSKRKFDKLPKSWWGLKIM